MVSIPGEIFWMGSPQDDEDAKVTERPQNEVKIVPSYLGKYPITQAQWRGVASSPKVKFYINPDPSEFKRATKPVDSISHVDAVEFCYLFPKRQGNYIACRQKRNGNIPVVLELLHHLIFGKISPQILSTMMVISLVIKNLKVYFVNKQQKLVTFR